MKALVPFLLAFALVLAGSPASAGEKAGVTLPDAIDVAGTPLVLNGLGIRKATILKIKVYVAGLYVEKKTQSAQEVIDARGPKRLVLHFVRDVSKEDVSKAWSESFAKIDAALAEKLKGQIDTLNSYMADLSKNDELVFTWLPGGKVEIKVKGDVKGTIAGDDFGRTLIKIWLGASPPNSGLKEGLLGQE